MDGWQATKALRQRGYQGPIIAVTANAITESKQKCIDTGFTDFFTKPFKLQHLRNLFSKYTTCHLNNSMLANDSEKIDVKSAGSAPVNIIDTSAAMESGGGGGGGLGNPLSSPITQTEISSPRSLRSGGEDHASTATAAIGGEKRKHNEAIEASDLIVSSHKEDEDQRLLLPPLPSPALGPTSRLLTDEYMEPPSFGDELDS